MIKFDIQLFGGRGADSGYGNEGYNSDGDGRPIAFYDKTDKYKGMDINEFKKTIKDRKVEWIGLYDEKGKIIIAGTSNNKGKVAIPTSHPSFSKVKNMTHNHPSDGARPIGGTFSGADVKNHVLLKFKTTSAIAKEREYYIKSNTNINSNKAYRVANKADNYLKTQGSKAIAKAKAKGIKMNNKTSSQIYLGTATKYWRENLKKVGITYSEKRN